MTEIRDSILQVRLTDAEMELLKQRAKQQVRDVSSLTRAILFGIEDPITKNEDSEPMKVDIFGEKEA